MYWFRIAALYGAAGLYAFGFVAVVWLFTGREAWSNPWVIFGGAMVGLTVAVAQFAIYAHRLRARLQEQYTDVVLSVGEDRLKDYEHARRFKEVKGKVEFEHNLKCTFSIGRFGCQDVAMYRNIDWELQPNMNVLLGRNGYGKTHLVRAMISILQRNDEKSAEFFEDKLESGILSMSIRRDDEDCLIVRTLEGFEESIGKVPVLAIPDARLINQSNDTLGPVNDKWCDLRNHSAHHFLYQLPYESTISTFLYEMCIDHGYSKRGLQAPVFKLVSAVVEDLTQQPFSFHEIAPAGNGRFRMEVITEGGAKRPLPIQKASQGTLSVVAMFGIIYYYLKALFPDVAAEELLEQRALVIIDEIDAHLHPVWQRRILCLLRKHFPNIQFIVTAHSPLVVGGCLENEVAVLQKASNESFSVYQFRHDFIGRELAEIYREVFEVEGLDGAYSHFIALSPRKDEFKKDLERLEAKKSLSAPEQKDLTRLRDQLHYISKVDETQQKRAVDEDLRRENEMLKAENGNLKDENKTLKAQLPQSTVAKTAK